jgi:hypothetical protein
MSSTALNVLSAAFLGGGGTVVSLARKAPRKYCIEIPENLEKAP